METQLLRFSTLPPIPRPKRRFRANGSHSADGTDQRPARQRPVRRQPIRSAVGRLVQGENQEENYVR